jgi:hypothetical protein
VRIVPEFSSAQIVLIGKFSPELFTPEWLAENGLIGESECRAAEVKVNNESIADIATAWCRLFATPEKFVVATQQAPWVRLSDLCLKLFVEVLPQNKIGFMGINRTVKFETGSWGARDRLGRALAPRNVWGEWGEVLERDEGKGASGLSNITMRQGHELTDRSGGHIEARIGPGEGTSVVMSINDHYESPEGEEESGSGELMRRLSANFEASIRRSDWIIGEIMKQVKP